MHLPLKARPSTCLSRLRGGGRLCLTLFACVWLAGCGGGDERVDAAKPTDADDRQYRIVGTVGMVADLVKRVAGERAEVQSLMDSGIDPHLYKPTRSDIARIASADVVFYNGLLLEGKMIDALTRAAEAGKKVYPVAELIDPQRLLQPDEFDGHPDPHVWMDPSAWAATVEVIRDKLIEHDPTGESVYRANAEQLSEQIMRLDAYAEGALQSVPPRQRVLVTAHDAFNYFGRRYGYEVVGIQGLSTESEAGVQDIERIVGLLVDRQIPAVFVESTVSQRNIQALINGARARGHGVTIGGELFSDAMGKPGSYEGTYLGMIDRNVTTVARALGGDAPAGGMQGKLSE